MNGTKVSIELAPIAAAKVMLESDGGLFNFSLSEVVLPLGVGLGILFPSAVLDRLKSQF